MLLLPSRIGGMMDNSLELRQTQPLNLLPSLGIPLALGNNGGPR